MATEITNSFDPSVEELEDLLEKLKVAQKETEEMDILVYKLISRYASIFEIISTNWNDV